jgi:hypothetical protein
MAHSGWRWVTTLGLGIACNWATPTPVPETTPPPARQRVESPQHLSDFLPATLVGRPADLRSTEDRVYGQWTIDGATVEVQIERITALADTLTPLELLGQDVGAVMGDQQLRGLRVQGNPAQIRWQLDPPHRATLDVIAVSTYHITVSVEPAKDMDAPLAFAEELDIGGMTRFAIQEHKKATAAPGSAD